MKISSYCRHDNGFWLIQMCIGRKSVFYLAGRLTLVEKRLGPHLLIVVLTDITAVIYIFAPL